jgi:hypothetical protein
MSQVLKAGRLERRAREIAESLNGSWSRGKGIRDGGIAAMELVARDLKSLGLYTARALSFAGVEYDILEHCLTPEQIAVYDAYADAWSIM